MSFKVPVYLTPRLAVILSYYPILAVMAVQTMALAEIGQLYGLISSDRDFGGFYFKEIPQAQTMAVIFDSMVLPYCAVFDLTSLTSESRS